MPTSTFTRQHSYSGIGSDPFKHTVNGAEVSQLLSTGGTCVVSGTTVDLTAPVGGSSGIVGDPTVDIGKVLMINNTPYTVVSETWITTPQGGYWQIDVNTPPGNGSYTYDLYMYVDHLNFSTADKMWFDWMTHMTRSSDPLLTSLTNRGAGWKVCGSGDGLNAYSVVYGQNVITHAGTGPNGMSNPGSWFVLEEPEHGMSTDGIASGVSAVIRRKILIYKPILPTYTFNPLQGRYFGTCASSAQRAIVYSYTGNWNTGWGSQIPGPSNPVAFTDSQMVSYKSTVPVLPGVSTIDKAYLDVFYGSDNAWNLDDERPWSDPEVRSLPWAAEFTFSTVKPYMFGICLHWNESRNRRKQPYARMKSLFSMKKVSRTFPNDDEHPVDTIIGYDKFWSAE
jgi:hypothetical protein